MPRTMTRLAAFFAVALVTLSPCPEVAGADADTEWRQWRGPLGNGVAPKGNPPLTWSDTDNVRWKVEIPGGGHASPIVLGDRLYLMTAVKTDQVVERSDGAAGRGNDGAPGENGGAGRGGRGGRGGAGGGRGGPPEAPTNLYKFLVLALDRHTGKTVWTTTVRAEVPHEGSHPTGTLASGSPVTDGEHIFAFFGSRGLYCLDLDGTVVWEKDLGDMRTRRGFGEGASPGLHANTIVVPWDHEGDSFVAAFDKRDGEEKWRVARDEATTWTTPVIVEANGRAQAVVAGTKASVSYDLETGAEIWRCSGLTTNVIPTPVVGHGMIYLTSGFRGSALQAVKIDEARGDITGTDAIAWSIDRGTPYVPSPLLSGRSLYFLRSMNGVVTCVDAITGQEHYAGERLETISNVYSSPVAAAGRVYICGREGNIAVLEDGPVFKVLANNAIGEGIDASPAIVGDVMYLRGSRHLFCIAAPRPKPEPKPEPKTSDASSGATWMQWRGPTRDGQFEGPTWPVNLQPEHLTRLWRISDLGPSYSGPIVTADRVFTTETLDEQYEVVHAFDRRTGEELWRTQWAGAIEVPFFAAKNGSWVRSTPAYDGERLFVAGMEDVLVCLDGATGAMIWKCDFKERYDAPSPAFGFVCSPLVVGDAVYVQAAGSFVKLDKYTGTTVWRTLVEGGGMDSVFSSPVLVTLAGRAQLVVQTRTELCGVDPDRGDVLWRQGTEAFRGMNILTPTTYGDGVIAAPYGGRTQRLDIARDEARDEESFVPTQAWNLRVQGYMTSPVVVDGHAYLFSRSNRFVCIDVESGEEKWTSEPTGDNYWSLVAQGDRILALSDSGRLRLIRATPEGYDVIDEVSVADDNTWAHLAVAGREVFVREQHGLVAYRWE